VYLMKVIPYIRSENEIRYLDPIAKFNFYRTQAWWLIWVCCAFPVYLIIAVVTAIKNCDIIISISMETSIFYHLWNHIYYLPFMRTWVHPCFSESVFLISLVFCAMFWLSSCRVLCAQCYLCYWIVHSFLTFN